MTPRIRHSVVLIALLALMVLGIISIDLRVRVSFRTACFLSGWMLTAMIGLIAIAWWRRPFDLVRQPGVHLLCISALLVLGFASHVEYRVPNGWLDLALSMVFAAMLVGAVYGAVLIRVSASRHAGAGGSPSTRTPNARTQRWLIVQVAVLYSLLAMSFVHAGVMHSHGFVAHFIAGR